MPLSLVMLLLALVVVAGVLQSHRPELPPTWAEYLERMRHWRNRPYDWEREGI